MARNLALYHEPVSLSKSALILSGCLTWANPASKWYEEDRVDAADTTKRDLGTFTHSRLDDYLKDPELLNLDIKWPVGAMTLFKQGADYADKLKDRCDALTSERAISINWEKGLAELLNSVTDRKYPVRDGWQNGTADLVGILKDGSLYIGDWKTGGTDGAREQLLSLACGFQRVMQTVPEPMVASFGSQPRPVVISCLSINEDGVWPHEEAISQAELDSHWDSMRFAWEDIGLNNQPNPGVHCTALYCPHLAYCEAITAGAITLASEAERSSMSPPSPANGTYSDKPKSDQEAGQTMALIAAARRQMKYVEAGIKDYIKNGGKVVQGAWEWSEGGNGFRWRKN